MRSGWGLGQSAINASRGWQCVGRAENHGEGQSEPFRTRRGTSFSLHPWPLLRTHTHAHPCVGTTARTHPLPTAPPPDFLSKALLTRIRTDFSPTLKLRMGPVPRSLGWLPEAPEGHTGPPSPHSLVPAPWESSVSEHCPAITLSSQRASALSQSRLSPGLGMEKSLKTSRLNKPKTLLSCVGARGPRLHQTESLSSQISMCPRGAWGLQNRTASPVFSPPPLLPHWPGERPDDPSQPYSHSHTRTHTHMSMHSSYRAGGEAEWNEAH